MVFGDLDSLNSLSSSIANPGVAYLYPFGAFFGSGVATSQALLRSRSVETVDTTSEYRLRTMLKYGV